MFETLKKIKTRHYLTKWKELTTAESLKQVYVKRSYQETDVYVDLYWFIKKDADTPHCDSIYRRTSWEHVETTIKHVEKHSLPRAIKENSKL